MLEGHFVSLALDPDYIDVNGPVYYVWKSIRSHTAPLFFTISGLVFTYLLLRDTTSSYFRHERVKKGIIRSAKLFFWGYLLHLDLHYLIKGHFSPFFFSFHVLQCLGTVLLTIVLLYGLYRLLRVVPIMAIFAVAGALSFILPPTMREMSTEGVLPIFQDLFGIHEEGERFQSAFPMFPWVGYALFGGVIGAALRQYPQWTQRKSFGTYFILAAAVLHFIPIFVLYVLDAVLVPIGFTSFFGQLYEFGRLGRIIMVIGGIVLLMQFRKEIGDYCRQHLRFLIHPLTLMGLLALSTLLILNLWGPVQLATEFTLSGFGHILLFITFVLIAIRLVPWNFDLFLKVGQYTLPVYVVHVIVLYSGLFGYGLNHFIRKSMSPWEAIGAAALFIIAFVYLVKYIEFFQLSTWLKKRRNVKEQVAEEKTN